MIKILFISDIVGKIGRNAVREYLPTLKKKYKPDVVIANAENLAHGIGATQKTLNEMKEVGVDMFTSGNHIFAQKEIIPFLDTDIPILRPLNYPAGVPGRGYLKFGRALVVNLIGRTFMNSYDCPFRAMDELLEGLDPRPPVIIVDFHAEATSEKVAMAWHLDGRATAVIGTHTHVQTADETILEGGTAYITDAGCVGFKNSAIGVDAKPIIENFLTQMPSKHTLAAHGTVTLNGVIIDFEKNRATHIERVLQDVDI